MHISSCLSTASYISFSPPSLSFSSPKRRNRLLPMSLSLRIAVVGDVHDDWDLRDDAKALHFLQPDLVCLQVILVTRT
ncbi:hypothetical protein MRB53_017905 [Persea americana]|uniref:Uncharacterized protein n=1 Tax=Persea americana TaxID=3435 RepID=A0ACC2M792_PERAE|nr:hypothetical protein MRB53_017905 [Persea americana]